jgi:hypothetical protein
MYSLTDSEYEIIKTGLIGPENLDYFCGYWFDKGDGHYFMFDRDFLPEFKWQKKLVFASQTLIVGVMGIGTGKTLGVGMAAYTWAMSTESFKFMNGANWAWQSQLMKELTEAQILDTPAERFIEKSVNTPYPKIVLGCKYGGLRSRSTLEYMSMDKQAAKIFTWRGDWINLDEAALVENLDQTLMNLSTRLTGKTSHGREYLARMSLMTNAWDNDSAAQVYYFYDLAIDNPEECLSISIPTSGNKNVTDRQVKQTARFINDPAEQERLLIGNRPEGRGKYFAKGRVAACADPYLSAAISQYSAKGERGYNLVLAPTLGAVEYQMPKGDSDYHFLLGDPGTGSYPARNAPCIAVIDASMLPAAPAIVKAFYWGNANGRIQPFIDKFYEYRDKYMPIFAGVDSTGPQSGMVQLMNLQKIWDGVLTQDTLYGKTMITGMDFSVGRKANMLLSLRNMVELGLIKWADISKGIKMQMYSYDPMLDRGGEPKIAQDIVATLAMAAFVIRAYYNIKDPNEMEDGQRNIPLLEALGRNFRRPAAERGVRR